MQSDAERRRWRGGSDLEDALRTGGSVAAGVILGHVMEGAVQASEPDQPAPPEPAYTPEPPPTDTSVSSWESDESDTGQSSW
jgi:hypothetical protein